MRRFFPIFIALIVGLLMGVSFGIKIPERFNGAAVQNSFQEDSNEQKISTVSIMLDFGGDSLRTLSDIEFIGGETLFAVLKRVAQEKEIPFEYKTYEGLGVLITKIGEKENRADGAYWQYWVNNEYANVGADAYTLKENDTILWKYTTYQGE